MITKEQANLICEAHEIFQMLENEEEIELLEENNPELLEAYFALHRTAAGADTTKHGGNHDESSVTPEERIKEGRI